MDQHRLRLSLDSATPPRTRASHRPVKGIPYLPACEFFVLGRMKPRRQLLPLWMIERRHFEALFHGYDNTSSTPASVVRINRYMQLNNFPREVILKLVQCYVIC